MRVQQGVAAKEVDGQGPPRPSCRVTDSPVADSYGEIWGELSVRARHVLTGAKRDYYKPIFKGDLVDMILRGEAESVLGERVECGVGTTREILSFFIPPRSKNHPCWCCA